MFSVKTIIDSDGYIVNKSIYVDTDNNILFDTETQILEGQQLVNYCSATSLVKPKWTGMEWIEGATEKEIKEWEEKNKPKPKEPTEIEILQKQLLGTQALVANLQEQILLKQNGGIK